METQKQIHCIASISQERINSIEYSIETRSTHQVRHIDIMTIATDRHQQKNTTGKHESAFNIYQISPKSHCLRRVHQTQVWRALKKVWEPLL